MYDATSLTQVIFGKSAKDERGAEGYHWTRVGEYGAKGIREYHEAHGPTYTPVILRGARIPKEISHYAESIDHIQEAWEYSDGSILMCASCSEFAGTFASHDLIEVNFFVLTPKARRVYPKTDGHGDEDDE